MRRTTGAVLAAALGLGLLGCGGGGGSSTTTGQTGDRTIVAGVARAYTVAMIDGDFARACSLMTPAARGRMASAAAATGGPPSCAGLLEQTVGAADAGAAGSTEPVVRTNVVLLSGDRARVRTSVDGQTDSVDLVRTGPHWLVDAQI